MNEIVWHLPCMSQEFNKGPKLRQDLGDQLAVAYDFETDTGEYLWEELIFTGVVGFRFTAARYCGSDEITAYDKVQTIRESVWAAGVAAPPPGLTHYRIFFDDAGCYEVLATGFVPPPEAL